MLPFDLADERYCVAIDRVRNVLERGALDADDADGVVAGRLDADGQTIRVVNLKRLFGASVEIHRGGEIEPGERVVVFDSRTGGEVDAWLVDEVYSAVRIDVAAVDRPSNTVPHVEGVVDADGERALWVDADSINGS